MGTTTSDTLYYGLAHAAPPPLSRHQLARINARWLKWLPRCTLAARRHLAPETHMTRFENVYRMRILQLLASNIAWPTIRSCQLDDPSLPQEEFNLKLASALRRRDKRPARTPRGWPRGKKRGPRRIEDK